MAIKYRVSTEHNVFPNLIIEERYNDTNPSVILGYRVTPQEGYVFYDATANDIEYDPETGLEKSVIYYKTVAGLPINFNFDIFPYVAVLRSEVDENYIFGGVTPPTETE